MRSPARATSVVWLLLTAFLWVFVPAPTTSAQEGQAVEPVPDLAEIQAKWPPVTHPVARTHPITGRKALFVNGNSTTHLVGLEPRENEVLLRFLIDHVRDPAFQCRFRWDLHSVAFWDNRSVQHYAVPDYVERRVMHRVTLAGLDAVSQGGDGRHPRRPASGPDRREHRCADADDGCDDDGPDGDDHRRVGKPDADRLEHAPQAERHQDAGADADRRGEDSDDERLGCDRAPELPGVGPDRAE